MTARRTGDRLFAAWFIFCALLSLAMIGVGIWAVVVLAQWVVTK